MLKSQPPQPEEAANYLTAAAALKPNSSGVHLNLGNALFTKGNLDGAIWQYKRALEINPRFAQAHLNLGNTLKRKGDVGGAIEQYNQALEINPRYAKALFNLGIALADNEDLDGAIKRYELALEIKRQQYKQALEIDPQGAAKIQYGLAQTHYYLARALAGKKDWDGTIQHLEWAIENNPRYAEAYLGLGVVLYQKRDLKGAIEKYNQAIQIDTPKYNEAVRINPQQAPEIQRRLALTHYSLGQAYHRHGDLDKAVKPYQRAIEYNSQFAEAHSNLGLILQSQGRFAEALRLLRSGHALGLRASDWEYRKESVDWVKEAERLVALDALLENVRTGKPPPEDADEKVELADLCRQPFKRLYATAARLDAEAFRVRPELAEDLNAGHRYNAACAAALAGCGEGEDAANLDEKERSRLRQQALDWLRADLELWAKLANTDKERLRVSQEMQDWLCDADFNGVRDGSALARLPEAERRDWQRLWAEVKEVLRQAAR